MNWRRFATVNGAVAVVFVILALFAPRLVTQITLIRVFTTANIFAMFASSWDILSGYTGQENFGHAAFIGASGFTVGLFTKYADHPLEPTLLLGGLVAGLLGLMIGVPALRLRGPYLALATLASATALLRLAFVFKSYTGGEEGISRIPNLGDGAIVGPIGRFLARIGSAGFGDLSRLDQITLTNYYVVLVVAVAMISGLAALGASKRGLVLRSIQQDEDAAAAAGVPTARYKVGAFVLSAAAAGVAGALWVHTLTQVNVDTLSVNLSLLIIVMAVLGGAGSIIGPAAGAYIVVLLQDYILDRVGISAGSQVKPMLFSAVLILVVILQPRGLIAPIIRRFAGRPLIKERAGG